MNRTHYACVAVVLLAFFDVRPSDANSLSSGSPHARVADALDRADAARQVYDDLARGSARFFFEPNGRYAVWQGRSGFRKPSGECVIPLLWNDRAVELARELDRETAMGKLSWWVVLPDESCERRVAAREAGDAFREASRSLAPHWTRGRARECVHLIRYAGVAFGELAWSDGDAEFTDTLVRTNLDRIYQATGWLRGIEALGLAFDIIAGSAEAAARFAAGEPTGRAPTDSETRRLGAMPNSEVVRSFSSAKDAFAEAQSTAVRVHREGAHPRSGTARERDIAVLQNAARDVAETAVTILSYFRNSAKLAAKRALDCYREVG